MPLTMANSSAWTKTVAVGVVTVASIVGNVSLSASEDWRSDGVAPASISPIAADFSKDPRGVVPFEAARFGDSESHSVSRTAPTSALSPPSDTPDSDAASKWGQVVPAIYAWDPDVRFVFYRHVSKWM